MKAFRDIGPPSHEFALAAGTGSLVTATRPGIGAHAKERASPVTQRIHHLTVILHRTSDERRPSSGRSNKPKLSRLRFVTIGEEHHLINRPSRRETHAVFLIYDQRRCRP